MDHSTPRPFDAHAAGESSAVDNITGTVKDVVIDCVNVGKYFQVADKIHHVFQGLNLQIERGTIFSLLGPSGCGKTTLLKCFVGRLIVDSGWLRVFNRQPRPGPMIGYMPQNIALLGDLTVRETLWLFGRLGQLDRKKTKVRMEYMLGILGMSSHIDIAFKKLSGGQQRRVAFAAALLNEAQLLILDEPTVGVDPILRQNIWTYLRSVVSRTNATVIITTHYIEEARNSETVGMLLDGRLLAVSKPEVLMKEYDCPTLEDVFLKLSIDDAIKNGYSSDAVVHQKMKLQRRTPGFICTHAFNQVAQRFSYSYSETFNMVRLVELTKTNCLCYVRHPWALLSAVLLPAFIFFVIPLAFDGILQHLKVAIVDHDVGEYGNHYVNSIDGVTIEKFIMNDYGEAIKSLQNGTVDGVIWIKRNYSSAMKQRFTMPAFATDKIIEESTILAALDYSNVPFAQGIYVEANRAYLRFAKKVAKGFMLNENIGRAPVELVPGISKTADMTRFEKFFTPGFILIVVFFVIAGNLCVINVSMAESGYYDRLYTTGVSSIEIILSQLGYQALIVGPQLLIGFFVVFYVNGLDCVGSFTLVISLAVVNYMSGVFLGLLLSAMSSSLHMAVVLFVVVGMLSFIMQGVMWPLDSMQEPARSFCGWGPFAYPAIALRNVINKGWPLTHPIVFSGFSISIIWAIINCLLTWIIYWFKK